MPVAREARGEGKHQRSFAVLSLDSLVAERQASDASILGAFQRWPDAGWKQHAVSLRQAGALQQPTDHQTQRAPSTSMHTPLMNAASSLAR